MPHQQNASSQKPPNEVILEIGGEGGSLTIFGICDPECGWRFTRVRDETTLRDMLPEDEHEGLEFYERSGYVASLVEALGRPCDTMSKLTATTTSMCPGSCPSTSPMTK